MKTLIFETYEDFKNREDESINGVSPFFAKANPDFEKQNETNIGCFNCIDCTDSKHSVDCVRCENVTSCYDCFECVNCIGCVSCKNCEGCQYSDDCEYCDSLHFEVNEKWRNRCQYPDDCEYCVRLTKSGGIDDLAEYKRGH